MWKLTLNGALVVAGTLAVAMTQTTSEKFMLRISSPNNATVDGSFVIGLHAGATYEAFAMGMQDAAPNSFNLFTLNTRIHDDDYSFDDGQLELHPFSLRDEDTMFLKFPIPTLQSNLVAPMFLANDGNGSWVAFDDEEKLHTFSGAFDDEACDWSNRPRLGAPPVPIYHVRAARDSRSCVRSCNS